MSAVKSTFSPILIPDNLLCAGGLFPNYFQRISPNKLIESFWKNKYCYFNPFGPFGSWFYSFKNQGTKGTKLNLDLFHIKKHNSKRDSPPPCPHLTNEQRFYRKLHSFFSKLLNIYHRIFFRRAQDFVKHFSVYWHNKLCKCSRELLRFWWSLIVCKSLWKCMEFQIVQS